MKCQQVQRMISPFLDSRLGVEESQAITSHLAWCRRCAEEFARARSTQAALSSLPPPPFPPALHTRLQVAASKEAARRRAALEPSHWLPAWLEGLKLRLENLLEPVAIPALGGLAATVVLFSLLMPTVAFRQANFDPDVPLLLWQEPQLKSMFVPPLTERDIAVMVWVNRQGRSFHYTMDPSLRDNAELRRRIENTLLFTQFQPATAFGQPQPSRVILYFNRRQIEVKG